MTKRRNSSLQQVLATVLVGGMAIAYSPRAASETIDFAEKQVQVDGSTNAARPGAALNSSNTISTGDQSYVQFSSENALFRAGSKTDLFLRENRNDLDLKQGIMLVSTDKSKGLGSTSATVHTEEARSRVKGTMQVSYRPQEFLKIVCIEGTVTVKLKATFGESVTITSGQMLIINPSDKRLPEPVEIDVRRLIDTAVLFSAMFPAIPWQGRIDLVVARQESLVARGAVEPTNLVITGDGLQVSEEIERGIERQRDEVVDAAPVPDAGGEGTPEPTPVSDPRNRPGSAPYYVDDSTIFSPTSVRTIRGGSLPAEVTGDGIQQPKEWLFLVENNPDESPDLVFEQTPTLTGIGTDFERVGFSTEGDLAVRGAFDVAEGTFRSGDGQLILSSRGRISLEDGAAISTLSTAGDTHMSLLEAPALRLEQLAGGALSVTNAALASSTLDLVNVTQGSGSTDISLEGATVNASRTGLQARDTLRVAAMSQLIGSAFSLSGRSVTIEDSSIVSAPDSLSGNGGIDVRAAEVINVDGSVLSSSAGDVQLQSDTGSPITIRIQNSSQLLALAQGAATTLNSSGGNISVDGSKLQAGKTLLLDTRDPTMDAMISVKDSSLFADLVKARAFNSGGHDAILIDNSTIDADSLLRLYAEGASTLRFRNNVNLKTQLAQLAGKTVEVDPGGNVIVDGTAEVYSDKHNYNRDTFGTINAQSVKQSRYSDRPAF
ncbi:MAG: hypothetical protein KDN22_01445 [Verrucomicrobiae bacterium]|nr:hypothetical protein [Verrucomicrobiae bacterium]